jgi:hypothetical protein
LIGALPADSAYEQRRGLELIDKTFSNADGIPGQAHVRGFPLNNCNCPYCSSLRTFNPDTTWAAAE